MLEQNFTDIEFNNSKGTYFYVLYKDNTCQYVGQTKNIFERLGKHTKRHQFDKVTYKKEINIQLNTLEANLIEADLIIQYQPLNNKRLPPNDFRFIDLEIYCNGNSKFQMDCPITLNMAKHILNERKIFPVYKNYYKQKALEEILNRENFHTKSLPLPIKKFFATGDIKGELYYHEYVENSLVYVSYAIINPPPPTGGFINIRIEM